MAQFSGVVRIGDVSDFISPTQACVVNVDGSKSAPAPALPPAGGTSGFQQARVEGDGNAVKVTLADCLACSGCVTSAETVLLQQQSTEELLRKLQEPGVTVIATLSPQSRASLAAEHGLGIAEASKRLVGFLKSLGVRYVLDAHVARGVALRETASDFIERYSAARAHLLPHGAPRTEAHAPSDPQQTGGCAPLSPVGGTGQCAQGPPAGSGCCGGKGARRNASGGADKSTDRPSGGADSSRALGSADDRPAAVAAEDGALRADGDGASAGGAVASDAAVLRAEAGSIARLKVLRGAADQLPLPMLASACPGWVCYAEKTHGDVVLPYISTAKSPQAVAGTLVKRHLCRRLGLDPVRVYHVAVMPCYDKKLEASRADFNLPLDAASAQLRLPAVRAGVDGDASGDVEMLREGGDAAEAENDISGMGGGITSTPSAAVPEVDAVITTAELHELMGQRGVALRDAAAADMDALFSGAAPPEGKLFGVRGGSGGYMEYVLKTAALELFGKDLGDAPLPTVAVRNSDLREASIEVGGGVVLRGAVANGFRNIQALVRKIKQRRCEYDYVEVMACPSGCLNGGGQIKVPGGQGAVLRRLELLDALYHDRDDVCLQRPEDDPQVAAVYAQVAAARPGQGGSRALFHTGYHRREKTTTSKLLDW